VSLRQPREIGIVNWWGVYTLVSKEVRRFFKVGLQTVLAPVVTTLLFLAVFSLALGRSAQTIGGVSFVEFLAPGLVVMAMIQNAFANTSNSVMMAKIQGIIVDVLMPPLTAGELTFGFVMGGMIRGVVVGIVVALAMAVFVPMHISHPGLILFHGIGASLMLSLMGLLTGIVAEKFDQQSTVSNFIITPLAFLSGTFYSIERLPPVWQEFALFNPFFYIIDGFRYGFIGHSDAPLAHGIAVVVTINVVLWVTCHYMMFRGYKLKS
jgi:ABC-2 type transport system permease protein